MSNQTKVVEKRRELSFDSKIGKFYLKLREKSLSQGLSKSIAIPYITKYIEEFEDSMGFLPTIAEFGCADGLILDEISNRSEYTNLDFTGFDFNESLITKARNKHPQMHFDCKDIYKGNFDEYKNKFDLAICINTIHEIFSFYGSNGTFNIERGHNAVMQSLRNIADTIKPDGYFILFDGIEYRINPETFITIKLKNKKARQNFLKFCREYKVFKPEYTDLGGDKIEISMRIFTRFITKYRFLNTISWELEQEESYQYFNRKEFEDAFKKTGFSIDSLVRISPNVGAWTQHVEILSEDIDFPDEHVYIIARKTK